MTNLKEIEKMPKLEKIHARKNKITNLEEFSDIEGLKYLNLRENAIGKVDHLSGIPKTVKILNLIGTPV